MRLVPTLGWTLEGKRDEPVDGRLVPLLAAIADATSLAQAVTTCGISYRAAWGLLRDYERKLGAPLVRLERGRGARLAPAGEALVRAQRSAALRLARLLPALATDLGPKPQVSARARPLRLRIAASHDLALAALAKELPDTADVELDLAVMGSLEALRAFAEGRADVAGFHAPVGRVTIDRAPFLRWLSARRDRLVRFVDRDQGLILPRGNPARVRTFRDVVRRKLRFVNRQRGSGTRLAIDWAIANEGLDAASLNGYGTEEFTHAAVAAMVASGGAEAGFGLRAAAAEYGLAFVPMLRERYFLAIHAKDIRAAAVSRLVDALQRPAFTQLVRRLPGYDASGAGSIVDVGTLAAAAPDGSVNR